jgi:hypothetical protein
MLASSDAARRTDEQINGYFLNVCANLFRPRFQVVHVHDPNGRSDLSEKLGQLSLSTPKPLTDVPAAPTTTASGVTTHKHFPASGHLRQFMRMAEDDKYSQREVVALVMFAAEGDNSDDAREMATLVAKSINVDISQWIAPQSWDGVFGDAIRSGAEGGLFW